jgi:hypothetical protein
MGRLAIRLSAYMFTTSAQVATLMSDVKEKRASAVATGSVNVFVTDFGVVLEMVANRLQPTTAANTSSVFLIDPEYASISWLSRPQSINLAKTGLSDKGELFADWTLKVMSEEAHGVLRGIDEAASPIALAESLADDEVLRLPQPEAIAPDAPLPWDLPRYRQAPGTYDIPVEEPTLGQRDEPRQLPGGNPSIGESDAPFK